MMARTLLLLACLLAGEVHSRIRVGYIVTSAAAGHMSNVYNWVSLANAFLNQSYQNTGFPQPASDVGAILAYVRVDPYNEGPGGFFEHLTRLAGTADGYFDYIHAERVRYGLDVVVLITDDPEYCGMAYTFAAEPYQAFAVTYWPCDEGQSHSVIGHEIGHLAGARHAPNQDPDNTVIGSSILTYVHGYCDDVHHFADVMTSNYTSCSYANARGNFYSNPGMLWNGFSAGEAVRSDVARLYREYFYRLTNAQAVPAAVSGCVNLQPTDYRDAVATGNINWSTTGARCIAEPGSRLALRTGNGGTVTLQEVEIREGAYLQVAVGGADPLGKEAAGEIRQEPRPEAVRPAPPLTMRMDRGRFHAGGKMFAGGIPVSLRVHDAGGRFLQANTLSAEPDGSASMPWTLPLNRMYYLRFSAPGRPDVVKPFIAILGGSPSQTGSPGAAEGRMRR